jgi:hypothetical protein
MLSTFVTVGVLVVLTMLALGQATNQFEATVTPLPSLEELATLDLGPLNFEQPLTSLGNAALGHQNLSDTFLGDSALGNSALGSAALELGDVALDLSLAEIRNDYDAFMRVYGIVESLERNLDTGDLAADILEHGEVLFEEAFTRSGQALSMDSQLSSRLLNLEDALRNGSANTRELYDELVAEFTEALNTSDAVLHRFTGEDTQNLLQALRRDLAEGQNTDVLLSDLDELYSELLKQYNDSRGHARGFPELSDKLQALRNTLQDTGMLEKGQLEQLVEEVSTFFGEG